MPRRVKNPERSKRRQRLRAELFAALGSTCAIKLDDRCEGALTVKSYEVHHVDGCTWDQRRCNAEHRLYRYRRELREGVRLQAACRPCNAAVQTFPPADPEVPF